MELRKKLIYIVVCLILGTTLAKDVWNKSIIESHNYQQRSNIKSLTEDDLKKRYKIYNENNEFKKVYETVGNFCSGIILVSCLILLGINRSEELNRGTDESRRS